MEVSLPTTIIVAALGNAGLLSVAWLNLKANNANVAKRLEDQGKALGRLEIKVDGIRSDLSSHDGSIRVLETEVSHLNRWREDVNKRCDVHVQRISKIERQVNGETE